MISGYISFNTVIAKIYRTLGNNNELNYGDMVEWAAEALSLIGAYSQYDEISECLTLTNGKAKLPCGFYKLVDINYKNKPVYWATNTNAHNYQCHNCRIPACSGGGCQYTFYINDSYLISNIEDENDVESNICIVYLGIPVDEEGIPLIPDNVYYQKAIESFIIYMLDYQDWRKSKIADKIYLDSEKNWLFYVNSARGAANMPNTAQLEQLKNVMRRLLPASNDYKKGFKNYDQGEQLNLR